MNIMTLCTYTNRGHVACPYSLVLHPHLSYDIFMSHSISFLVIKWHLTGASVLTGVKPLIVTAVTINPIWRTPKKEKSIFCFIDFFVALFKILSMEE